MLALIILVISYVHLLVPGIAKFRPGLLAVGIVTVLAYLNPGLLVSGSILRTTSAKFIAALFVIACLSIPFGISIGTSGKFMVDTYIKTMVFTLLVIAGIRHCRDLYTVCWAFLISCGVLCYISLFMFDVVNYGTYSRLDNLMNMYDANDLGCVLASGIGIGILLVRTSGRAFSRLCALILLIGIFASLAKTGSRGGFLGIMAVGLAVLFLDRGTKLPMRILVLFGGFVAISYFAPHGYWSKMQTILDTETDYNYTATDGRKQIMQRGLIYIRDYPVLGLGLGNFTRAECTISPIARNAMPGEPLKCNAPHNTLLQVGAELGLTGLVVWLCLIIGGIVMPLRSRSRMPAHWKNGDAEERFLFHASGLIPIVMVGFISTSIFLSFAFMDLSYLLFAILAGYQVAFAHKVQQNRMSPPPMALMHQGRSVDGWRVKHSEARAARRG